MISISERAQAIHCLEQERMSLYEGTSEWINSCLKSRGVKGSYTTQFGVIKEAIIGDFLEQIK